MVRVAVALSAALAILSAPAHAAAFVPVDLPGSTPGQLVRHLLAPAGEEGAFLVRSNDDIYGGPGPVVVDAVRNGRVTRRVVTTKGLLVASAQRADGALDLLLRQGKADPDATGRVSLELHRVRDDGTSRRLWQSTVRLGRAALTSAGRREAIVFTDLAAGTSRPRLRVVTSRDGVRFAAARTQSGVLPRFLAADDPAFVNGFDAVLAPGGALTFALTAFHRPAPQLVLASLSPTGRIRARQITSGVDGLVSLERSATGRIGALVDDTGIEGERGECVGDGEPRTLSVASREAGAGRFASVRRLDQHPFKCSAGGSELVALPDGRLVAAWTRAGATDRPAEVRTAVADVGAGWRQPSPDLAATALAALTGTLGTPFLATQGVDGVQDAPDGTSALRAIQADGALGPARDLPSGLLAVADRPGGAPLLLRALTSGGLRLETP